MDSLLIDNVVIVDLRADQAALAASYADPHRYDRQKLFGCSSNWEFDTWDRTDTVGFGVSVLVVFAIIGMLCMLMAIGS